jgi:hypothetical protein
MLQGDDLTVQLSIGGAALTLLGVAMTQAGWTHKWFVRSMFALAALLAIACIGWRYIETRIPAEWLSYFARQIWFLCLLAGVFGFTLGSWVNNKLRSRGRNSAPEVDRIGLASRAEELCRKISALAGEHAGERAVAWGQGNPNESPFARTGPIDARFLERFGSRHGQEFWSIIAEAKKVISIDDHQLWSLSHGLSSASDLNAFLQFMAKLASDLRYGGKDVLTATEVGIRLHELESMRTTAGQYATELVALRAEVARQKEAGAA